MALILTKTFTILSLVAPVTIAYNCILEALNSNHLRELCQSRACTWIEKISSVRQLKVIRINTKQCKNQQSNRLNSHINHPLKQALSRTSEAVQETIMLLSSPRLFSNSKISHSSRLKAVQAHPMRKSGEWPRSSFNSSSCSHSSKNMRRRFWNASSRLIMMSATTSTKLHKHNK